MWQGQWELLQLLQQITTEAQHCKPQELINKGGLCGKGSGKLKSALHAHNLYLDSIVVNKHMNTSIFLKDF